MYVQIGGCVFVQPPAPPCEIIVATLYIQLPRHCEAVEGTSTQQIDFNAKLKLKLFIAETVSKTCRDYYMQLGSLPTWLFAGLEAGWKCGSTHSVALAK